MKNELNPVVVAVVLILVVGVIGFFLWNKTAGKTFTREEASGRLELKLDPSKIPAGAGSATGGQ